MCARAREHVSLTGLIVAWGGMIVSQVHINVALLQALTYPAYKR